MKCISIPVAVFICANLLSCGGGRVSSNPPDPHNPDSYNGNYYYAEVSGAADLITLPGLPANVPNQVLWNSIALLYDTFTGSWTVAMNQPDYYPNTDHPVVMGPFSGIWTRTPEHAYQYRVTSVVWNTGNAGNANPVNRGVPYAIFQPTAPTGWTIMPSNSRVNLCSVSANAVYTTYLGGGSISCAIEVMDMSTSEVAATSVNLRISNDRAP